MIAALLDLDALPCHLADPAQLAFDYCAGRARRQGLDRPRFLWDCPICEQAIADHRPASAPASSQRGHADGCERLATDVAEWEHA